MTTRYSKRLARTGRLRPYWTLVRRAPRENRGGSNVRSAVLYPPQPVPMVDVQDFPGTLRRPVLQARTRHANMVPVGRQGSWPQHGAVSPQGDTAFRDAGSQPEDLAEEIAMQTY